MKLMSLDLLLLQKQLKNLPPQIRKLDRTEAEKRRGPPPPPPHYPPRLKVCSELIQNDGAGSRQNDLRGRFEEFLEGGLLSNFKSC